jgi:hypothetical protein
LLEAKVLSEYEKEKYMDIMNMKAERVEYTNVILHLTEYLKRHFKESCIVIIDEYDTPIQSGYIEGYFEEVIEFQKSMLVKGFKDNNALKQGILTGIMKVAQESIFSDFNNPSINTILSERYKDKFGFTEAEVEKMAEYLELTSHLGDIKKWYDGYIFGIDTVIYNPWSIIKFMSMPEDGLKPYWINTSDNRMIKDVMQLDKAEDKKVVEKLIKGEEVAKVIEENIVYQSIKDNPDVAWSFLLHAGYLKTCGKERVRNKYQYKLAIPNIEIQTIYEDIIVSYLKEDEAILGDVNYIIKSLFDNDTESFERLMKELYLGQVSYHDTSLENLKEWEQKERFESFHHGFMLGLFVQMGTEFIVESNKEYGLGRPDIVIIPKDTEKTAYVFEFKWDSVKGSKTLDMLANEAVTQIEEKKYKEGVYKVHGHENIVCIGIGFKGKELKILINDKS